MLTALVETMVSTWGLPKHSIKAGQARRVVFPMEYQGKEESLFYAKTVTLFVRQHHKLCGDGF